MKRRGKAASLGAGIAILAGAAAWPAAASAEELRYALIVGNNSAPPSANGDRLAPLAFADDDAFAFYELRRELGDQAVLLAAPDDDTRRRYARSAPAAAPPTEAALDQAVARLAAQMRSERRAGRTQVLSFFYSGHGALGEDGQSALTLLDGLLTRRALLEKVLDRIPADVVHLSIDACHAEDLVRARDASTRVVALSREDVDDYLAQSTLARHPNVGMALANSRSGDAHEWDAYQSGVFTHQLISALRGAADVNGDGRVEYSELGAFLAAANREVEDPRARLKALVRPPAAHPHAAITDFSGGPAVARLTGITAARDAFSVEDGTGYRLVEGRPELGFTMTVALPANRTLFLRRGEHETEFVLRPGADLDFRSLALRPRASRTRGSLESALRVGLFAAQYGPAYYRGYVDRADGVTVPAVVSGARVLEAPSPAESQPARGARLRPWLGGAAAALLGSSVVFGGLAFDAWRDNQGAVERASADASDRFRLDTALAAGFLVSGVACAVAAALVSGGGERR